MKLSSLIIRNIKRNFKRYAMYFISLSFSVFTVYSFFSLIENETVLTAFLYNKRYRLMLIGFAVIIMVFVMFFLISSNNSFIKARKKEISTYLLFGMTNKKTGKMLFFETILVGTAALITGIGTGIFFSKLTAMVLLGFTLADFKGDIAFTIGLMSVFITAGIFGFIFCLMGFSGFRVIKRFELVDLFKAEKVSEGRIRWKMFSLVLSCILIGSGYFLAINNDPAKVVFFAIPILCVVIGGTYLFFRGGLAKFTGLLKKNKNRYYKGVSLISTSSFSHRIKTIAGTMATIAVLSAVATTAIATGYTLYSNIEKNTYDIIGFDFYYYSNNSELINDVYDVFNKHNVKIIKQYTAQRYTCVPKMEKVEADNFVLYMSKEEGYYFRVYSESVYNNFIKVSRLKLDAVTVNENEAVLLKRYINDDIKKAVSGAELEFSDKTLKVTSCMDAIDINFGALYTIIINDNDFNELVQSGDISITDQNGTMYDKAYVFKYENPLDSKELCSDLKELLKTNYRFTYDNYAESMETFGLVCFIGFFMSLVFILMTASMLYFKQIMAAEEERNQYRTLRKIGLDEKTERKVIAGRLLPVFSIPLAVGIIHSIFAMKAADTMVFSNIIPVENSYLAVLTSSCIMYGVYALVYMVFYFITKGQYRKIVK